MQAGRATGAGNEVEQEIRTRFQSGRWKEMGDQMVRLQTLAQRNLDVLSRGATAALNASNMQVFDRVATLGHLNPAQIDVLRQQYNDAVRQAERARTDYIAANPQASRSEIQGAYTSVLSRATDSLNEQLMPPQVMRERLAALRGKTIEEVPLNARPYSDEMTRINPFLLAGDTPPIATTTGFMGYTSRDITIHFCGVTSNCEVVFRQPREETLAQVQQANPQSLQYGVNRDTTFRERNPYLRHDGRDVTTGYFSASFEAVVPEHIRREELRAEFIDAVRASREYTALPTEQAKEEYLSVRLLETYRLMRGRYSSQAISDYGNVPRIQEALNRQREVNRRAAATPATPGPGAADVAMQSALEAYQSGSTPVDVPTPVGAVRPTLVASPPPPPSVAPGR